MRQLRRITCWAALWAVLAAPCPVRAQETPSPPPAESPAQMAARIKAVHPKTLVLVFDVSESTRHGGMFGQERAAAATLIRQGTQPGDRVVLETFGTGYKTVFDKTLAKSEDAGTLVDQLPASAEPGHGTNIRWPHHEALRLIHQRLPQPGVIVLLTDSFNDRPLESDPAYPKYLDYYTLKSLTVYPDTRENRDYERLLRTLKASGKLTQFGVGVGIAPSGRPIERLPVGPGQGDAPEAAVDLKPQVLTPSGREKAGSSLPTIIGGIVLALLALAAAAYALLNRPVPVRLSLGEKGAPRDYRLRPGAKIGLGGAPTAAAPGDEAFPLAGLPAPVAFVQAGRGGASLVPGPALSAAPAPQVFHNGLALERPTPLRVGDEIRIALPASDAAPAREHRVRFADPHAAAF